MEFKKILGEVEKFEDVKELLETKYSLVIKEDEKYSNLYMVTYDFGKMPNNSVAHNCRGLIVEKDTNRIVCYSFNKIEDIDNEWPEELEWDSCKIEEALDGTQIRLFNYEDEWIVSTTRCIDANRARWFTKKSFREMFDEVEELDYEKLDKNNCYSFVLMHPENRIVVPYKEAKLAHVMTRNMETLEEVDEDIGIEKPQNVEFESFENMMERVKKFDLEKDDDGKMYVPIEGYLIRSENGTRYKVTLESYLSIRDLRGNANNLFYRYLQLRQNGKLELYAIFFPEHEKRFAMYEIDYHNLADKIHEEYRDYHVNHKIPELSAHFRSVIWNIHGRYLKTREKTTKKTVLDEMDKLDAKLICYMYNNTFGSEKHHPYK